MIVSSEVWNLKDESFGPFLKWIKDDNVTDINYNGRHLWIEDLTRGRYMALEKNSKGEKVPVMLEDEFVNQFCTRIANVVSQSFNKYNNLLEAETDTLRISVIHSSVSHTGTSISIRKTPAIRRMNTDEMLKQGYCDRKVLNFLINCIRGKMNMVFCGLPGTGKTELLKYLTQYIPWDEKVMTIEDNLEIHFRSINKNSNCVELKVDEEFFPYTKAIKAALRQNPQWVLLSEARSEEVKYLIESFSTGLHGLTTIHTDDCRKIPDRIKNMMKDDFDASRLENNIYSFINVGVLVRKKVVNNRGVMRYIDQICVFDRDEDGNSQSMIVSDGRLISEKLPANIMRKFKAEGITEPFSQGGSNGEEKEK